MGVFTALDGSMKYELEEIGDKLDRWVNLIVNRYLHRRLVWNALWENIWCTIAYPLPVMTLTEEQGEWLTKELYTKLLPAMVVNRNFHRAYLHASKISQGMGLP